ncbi:MAG TPA: glycosyltransferase family 39 protein [Patescibacteria group bacterium]|uniref:Uncharacterized protein n=1 Tax=Candidatus Woesebacteria bacterium RBG_13_46_13 TaxID=1802479 RepID=A0A1F7X4R0_9BACT|nr:MAG: hypothetical protein A2Y68_00095 [Candidatus Woesebacteria bacterium RBG_13_46_13]HJX58968.1 glycosyltransferase family 39 protein [Patescibacteria group bacterium]
MVQSKIKTGLKVELALVAIVILAGLLIRSVNYKLHLNFSTDQAVFSTNALEIFRERKITLLGPTASFIVEGRRIFQGSVIFYTDLAFLLFGNFDPIKSSFAFTVFSVLMIFPLYFGVKWLSNKKTAFFVSIIYSLLPFYVNYTRFLFNINFQLALTPLLIFSMGLYEKVKKRKSLIMAFTGIITGILVQFHYQFVVVALMLVLYYWFFKKIQFKSLLLLFLGMVTGFLPMIIFEIRHNFYNLQTILFFIQRKSEFAKNNLKGFGGISHYFLTISIMLLVILSSILKPKFKNVYLSSLFFILFSIDLYLYIPKPTNSFGNPPNWNYLAEAKAHEYLMEENLSNFNVVNLAYDTVAEVQKYLLRKDGVNINFEDYYHNNYLFVISNKKFIDDPAYEIRTFKPSRIIKTWKLNDFYSLYLLKRG